MNPEDQVDTGAAKALNLTDAELLNILREGAEEVFMMLGAVGELVDENHGAEDHAASQAAALADIAYEVMVEFSGPKDGVVVMRCQESCANNITRGMLSMEECEPVAQSEIHDALGECTNMLGGFFKRQALDPRGSFRLGIPKIAEYVAAESAVVQGSLIYELSDSRASVEVWLDEQAQ
ncbi:MAG: chemotaxis protein CheX [Planctomycetota bacterium]|nr:chemotaxis protein CheX [Planctomycetota bacterium]